MKVTLPTMYVAYGPVGHPKAAVFLTGTRDYVDSRLTSHLVREQGQGNIPAVFFSDAQSPESQGYHVLEVVGDEVPDAVIAALPVPPRYKPIPKGLVPGRHLVEFQRQLPSFIDVTDFQVWAAGEADCDHDFGLEGVSLKYQLDSGDVLDEGQVFATTGNGKFYYASACSRCGAIHAYPEKDD